MITGYGDKEQQFLDSLEGDTGRNLAQWMDAIRTEGLTERNDIIDWLRRQGFRFSRAAWLERVHHNGGKPIYAGRAATGIRPPRRPKATQRLQPASPAPQTNPSPAPSPQRALGTRSLPQANAPAAAPPTPTHQDASPAALAYAEAAGPAAPASRSPLTPDILALTAKAKAYRPLAEFLLQEIAKKVPNASFSVQGQQIAIATPAGLFARLTVSARDLRLTLSSGAVTLNDARQIDEALLAQITAAARHAT